MPTEVSGAGTTRTNGEPLTRAASSPSVVISLDFELRWGMYDRLGLDVDAYRSNLENVREIVPALLGLFAARKIRVTWACVGALGCANWEEYFRRAPAPPKYQNARLRFDPRYADLDPNGCLHFAPDLLSAIHATPGQELGSHTFSHILMREPGVAAKDVEGDMAAAAKLWQERCGAPPRSLVFPRNQIAFLPIIRASTIKIWRGNAPDWFHDRYEVSTNTLLPRAFRLLDSVNPWARRALPLEGDMTRASLFLRTDLPRAAWRLHFACIRRELDGLRLGEVFHLYWHPHNLGTEMAIRLGRVENLLEDVAERLERGKLVSRSMGDLVA
jgi:peptidoglycan/xylan/chitin deacetylase (PgdA/CDA1 family)